MIHILHNGKKNSKDLNDFQLFLKLIHINTNVNKNVKYCICLFGEIFIASL